MNITDLISMNLLTRMVLWITGKNKEITVSEAVKILDKHFEELQDSRINNDKMFYLNFPKELEVLFADKEEVYSLLTQTYNNAYSQGYADGITDLNDLIGKTEILKISGGK